MRQTLAAYVTIATLMCATCVVAQTPMVSVYSTHFEMDGRRFESATELRTYLESIPFDVYNADIRECDARARVPEIMSLLRDVLAKRRADRGESPSFVAQMGYNSPVSC